MNSGNRNKKNSFPARVLARSLDSYAPLVSVCSIFFLFSIFVVVVFVYLLLSYWMILFACFLFTLSVSSYLLTLLLFRNAIMPLFGCHECGYSIIMSNSLMWNIIRAIKSARTAPKYTQFLSSESIIFWKICLCIFITVKNRWFHINFIKHCSAFCYI